MIDVYVHHITKAYCEAGLSVSQLSTVTWISALYSNTHSK